MRTKDMFGVIQRLWIYVVALLITVFAILAYFRLNPATENPPLP